MRARTRRWVLLASMPLLGCAPTTRVAKSGPASYCAPPFETTLEPAPSEAIDERLRRRYPARSLELAQAVGVASLLARLEEATAGSEEQVALVRARIFERLFSVHLQVASMVAELDCEGERARQLSASMRDREESIVRWLTATSVITGALTTIVTAVVEQSSTAQEVIGITGGVLGAGLGLGTFLVKKKRRFQHERNLLAEIWAGPVLSTLYPRAVWAYLTRREFSNDGVRSIRENIVGRWQRYHHPIPLFFGPGGDYTSVALTTRADLLDQLKSSVDSMNQELAYLRSMIP